jgi:hypothetical protein
MISRHPSPGSDFFQKFGAEWPESHRVSRSALADVTAGSFIGTTVAPQPDGTFKSTEVHIFAPALRGTGEGLHK